MIRRTMVVAASLAVAALCACAVLVLAILFDGSMRHTATVLAAFEALALSQAMLHGEGVGPMLGIGLDALRKAVLALCFAPVALAALLGEAVQTASLVWYAGLSGGPMPGRRNCPSSSRFSWPVRSPAPFIGLCRVGMSAPVTPSHRDDVTMTLA